jgi:probable F420-dependent oxidoreductase
MQVTARGRVARMRGMKLGVVHFTGSAIRPQDLAVAVEERGFESLFYTEHTHIPVAAKRTDGSSARGPANTFDPFIALAAAASVTARLILGTGVCLLAQRDVITTAKEVASLDRLSDGRVLLGIGPGWDDLETANHGVDPRHRRARMREAIRAMQAIWSQDEAEFHGAHVDFDPLWSWPKPSQPGGPPIYLGGNGPSVEASVVAFADGWLPQCGKLEDVDELRTRIVRLQQAAAAARSARHPGHAVRRPARRRAARAVRRRRRRPLPAARAFRGRRRCAAHLGRDRAIGWLVIALDRFWWQADSAHIVPAMVAQQVAFEDVSVLPMDTERLLTAQTVVVDSGRVSWIGPAAEAEIPGGARRIDGRGRYLMPGLTSVCSPHHEMPTLRGGPR